MKPTIPITSNIIFPDGERYGEAMAETPQTGAGSMSILLSIVSKLPQHLVVTRLLLPCMTRLPHLT
jgi:hypothetical protein